MFNVYISDMAKQMMLKIDEAFKDMFLKKKLIEFIVSKFLIYA